jgi:CRISPR/Cas system CSM-associated protein Csm3 (group 7 of RAMP superfamily)
VVRDGDGFPYVPGKTIKGLLREAAEVLYEINAPDVSRKLIDECFGIQNQADAEKTINGKCYFSNAEISYAMKSHIAVDSEMGSLKLKKLFSRVTSTAIESETGVAKEHSLRRIEVVNPVPLQGVVSIPEGESYERFFYLCFQMVKRLGTGRNRGFGRCGFELIKEGGVQ